MLPVDADDDDLTIYSPHHLAIIVPFRDRFEELQDFVPHMHRYLKEKGISFSIYIVNQADRHRYFMELCFLWVFYEFTFN